MTHRIFITLMLSMAFLSACNTGIDAKNYKKTCTTDATCATVFSGDSCANCQCTNAAISTTETARYTSDWSTLHSYCPKSFQPNAVQCSPCENRPAVCLDGTCVIAP